MSDRWLGIDGAWREAFALAWEAYRIGSPPVGAAIVDSHGTVVARGRSRRSERTAPPNQLAGSRLAHAEVNALAGLAVDEHAGLVMYVTLEPCLLCAAAIATSHVPVVRFAGQDPMWRFLQTLPEVAPGLADRWYETEGPLPGRLGAWAALLALVERLERNPQGVRIDEYERVLPDLVKLAQELLADGHAAALRRLSLDEALDAVWERLPSC